MNSEGAVTQTFSVTVSPDPNAPSITVTSPAAGDVWYVGTTRKIRWTTANLDNVVLYYTTDNGAYVSQVTTDTIFETDPRWGAYPWQIPNEPSVKCAVLVVGYWNEAPTWSELFKIGVVTDNDGDGMDDGWDILYLQDTWQDGTMDFDGDGHSNLDEFLNGTDPSDPNDPGGTAGTRSTGSGCVPGRVVRTTPWTRPGPWAGPAALVIFAALWARAAARRRGEVRSGGRK